MTSFLFCKYHHLGNDFLVFDDRKRRFPTGKKEIQRLCHRNLGMGCDGILLLQPSLTADFCMRIFNSDGTEASSCGNGLLSIGKFCLDLGLFHDKVSIETLDKIVTLYTRNEKIALSMEKPYFQNRNHSLVLEGKEISFSWVHSGVPHVVIFEKNIDELPVEKLGRSLRHHPFFAPSGTNVNFACCQGTKIQVRTFERGVEKETLSCGTGAMAVAFVAFENGWLSSPLKIDFFHGSIEVSFAEKEVSMIGLPTFIGSGMVSLVEG
ncbi:MAG: diaminopimelate epimerase [Chlamydiota bacterium]